MAADMSSSDSLDFGTSPEDAHEAADARGPAADPAPATTSAQPREESAGAAVARSETGGPPIEKNNAPEGASPEGSCAADARGTLRRRGEVSASPTPERPQRAARAAAARSAAARSDNRPRDVRAAAAGRAAAARSRSAPRGEERRPLVLRAGDVTAVLRLGRTFVPLPSHLQIPEDRLLPDAALGWDGVRYTRGEFVAYYGTDELFFQARRTTEMARAFMAVWYDYCAQQNDHSTINHLLVLMRKTEWREDPALAEELLRYVFRALTLRGAVLGLAAIHDGSIASIPQMQRIDERVRRWAVPFYRAQGATTMDARQLQRLYWVQFFGHKTLVMTLAQHGARDWLRTMQELQRHAHTHDTQEWKDAVARSRGAPVSKSAPPYKRPHTSDIGIWRDRTR